ncbi:sulfite reductase flavoprotein subunit alpha [Sphingomonas sp. HITSZ_GF]|uniref:sulfite reductase flavoprotein subunit alpha n=1 Tax=Sphingomonas sp. HITSZ_GF TaxID=3037247 RepID=UPI00240E0773|nr:sulfite reductase flavoprotein subunit alpha [Sphingomonas sp. HITSZ_GF]MDG2534238.1 sulfite reductase flavoprotein subunit alpha [Sphingomonas sp. HITSZ_GF]
MIRRVLFQIHWLLGITAGLVLALVGVTGATMAFEDEIMAALSPGIVTLAPSRAPVLAPDALAAAITQQRPDLGIRQLVINRDPGLAAEVTFLPEKGVRRGEHQFVDPRTGILLGPAKGEAFFATVMDLHRWLALPGSGNGWGRQITGFAAFALIFFALSGLYLRWPRRALDWRSWFVLDLRKTGRNLYRTLHATIGTWLAILYLFSATTGLTWSYAWYKQGAVYLLTGKAGGAGEGRREPAKDAPPVNLAAAWAQLLRSDGSRYQRVTINLPQGKGPVAMRILPKGARFDRMTDELRFDATTGALVKAERYAERGTGATLAANFYALHTGSFFGTFGRIMLMLSAGTMPLFTVTGLLLYFARRRAKRALQAVAAADVPAIDAGGSDMLVIHASQTGNAERIARMSAAAFPGASVRALGSLDPEELRRAARALFVVATYGQGDAPDRARAFESRAMAAPVDLAQLDYAVLALGDHEYEDFCAFGYRVDAWLHAGGAKRLFDLVEMDGDDADAERHWQQQLAAISGHAIEPDWRPAAYARWTLTGREQVNPGSPGEPVYRVTLAPEEPADWAPGAIAEVMPRHDPARIARWLEAAGRGEDAELRAALADKILPEAPPADLAALRPLAHRDYSVASIAASGQVDLLVRLARAEDGGPGIGSGYLCTVAAIGETVSIRLRDNPGFAAPEDRRVPLVLIGNGTGIAGLMGHLRDRAREGGAPAWLLFGERSRAHDRPFVGELDALVEAGTLARLDLAFSREPDCGRYVQHLVAEAADDIQAWADRGAAFYVCGSLAGMASGVDAALREVLGDARVEAMLADGLYRRDIY